MKFQHYYFILKLLNRTCYTRMERVGKRFKGNRDLLSQSSGKNTPTKKPPSTQVQLFLSLSLLVICHHTWQKGRIPSYSILPKMCLPFLHGSITDPPLWAVTFYSSTKHDSKRQRGSSCKYYIKRQEGKLSLHHKARQRD